jgi:ABC-2 type transport system permease protein
MNTQAVKVIYKYEMLRAWNTILQSFASPVISTVLYFVVFGLVGLLDQMVYR